MFVPPVLVIVLPTMAPQMSEPPVMVMSESGAYTANDAALPPVILISVHDAATMNTRFDEICVEFVTPLPLMSMPVVDESLHAM